jgi:hypothetical protein
MGRGGATVTRNAPDAATTSDNDYKITAQAGTRSRHLVRSPVPGEIHGGNLHPCGGGGYPASLTGTAPQGFPPLLQPRRTGSRSLAGELNPCKASRQQR